MGKKKNSRNAHSGEGTVESSLNGYVSEEEEEDILGNLLEDIGDKTKSKRMKALRNLRSFLAQQWNPGQVQTSLVSLSGAVFDSMKKGTVEERCVGASILGLLIVTFGSLDDVCTSLFEKLKFAAGKILSKSIQDDYSDFIEACSIGYFVAAHQPQETINFMRVILDIALQGSIAVRTATCIHCWTLLCISVPHFEFGGPSFVESSLRTMSHFLFQDDTAVRSAAGEAISVVYDHFSLGALNTEDDDAAASEAWETGLEKIIQRMRDIERNIGETLRKSKKDRSQQRGDFKEYLRIIEGGLAKGQKIALSHGDSIMVESLQGIVITNAFRKFLGDGFLCQIKENPYMHELLDYQPTDLKIERVDDAARRDRSKARKEDRRAAAAYKNSMIY